MFQNGEIMLKKTSFLNIQRVCKRKDNKQTHLHDASNIVDVEKVAILVVFLIKLS